MENRNIFYNLSPLDHRYYLANRDLFERLALYLSEEAGVRYCIRIELELLATLLHTLPGYEKHIPLLERIANLEHDISSAEVYQEEEKTRHNIRAVVNVLKRRVPAEINHLVHMGATSADILDTSASLRMRDAVRKVILPLLIELETELAELSLREAETAQIGRTHGQHAVPVTFGFAVAEYVARLGKSIMRIERKSQNLRGKLAGAVGAYNATSLIVADPVKLEKDFLGRLGIEPSEYATQLVEPEYALELLTEINIAFGIIANLADDLRNLQRSEIDEVREVFGSGQVGSSTMPQKRNPWNSENVKSMWKAFAPRVMTFFMDQISEHQRDLTNSASARFVSEYLTGFAAAASRIKSVVMALVVNRERMQSNLGHTGALILAEAAYILLSMAGEPDGHEIVRQLILEAEKRGSDLVSLLKQRAESWTKIDAFLQKNKGMTADRFFAAPQNYRGLAAEKTRAIATKYAAKMKELADELAKTLEVG